MKAKLRELQKQLVRPVTKENVFYHYLPMFGVKSYLELSINIFNPSLSSEIYKRLVYNQTFSIQVLDQTTEWVILDSLVLVFTGDMSCVSGSHTEIISYLIIHLRKN